MNALEIAGIGAIFSLSVVAGLAIGVYAGRATGASWLVVVGIFAGFVLGATLAARRFMRAMR